MGDIIFTYTIGNTTLGDVVPRGFQIVALLLTLVVYVTFYVLRSIGIYTLAKNNGVQKPGLAWVPFVWMYTLIKLVGEYKFFGKKYDKLALLLTILCSLATVSEIVYNVLAYLPLVGYFFSGGDVYIGENAMAIGQNIVPYWTYDVCVSSLINYPYPNFTLMRNFLIVYGYVVDVLYLVYAIIEINVFIAVFRRFLPRHFILATIVSVFGGFSIFIFAVRKNKPIEEILRNYANTHRYGNPYGNPYGQNGPYGNPYGNPYGQNGGYNNPYGNHYGQNNQYGNPYGQGEQQNNQNGGQNNSQGNSEPFGEFGGESNEPFEEIFNRKKGDDK